MELCTTTSTTTTTTPNTTTFFFSTSQLNDYHHQLEGLLDGNGQPVSPQRMAGFNTPPRSGKQKRRMVCFAEDVKMHDGLTLRKQILDELITHYFVNQREVSELHVLEACRSLQSVKELEYDLTNLRDRIEEGVVEGKISVPVLPEGGGACTKLAQPHVPYINVLLQVIAAAFVRASAAIDN